MTLYPEGPGPLIESRDSIVWDTTGHRYLIIVPQGYSDVNAQKLLAFFGEVLGHNVDIRRVGANLYGARYDNIVLIDWAPKFGKGLSDEVKRENQWWHTEVACRFLDGEGLWH